MIAYSGSSRHLAVRGVAAILFGIATLVWPGVTVWALVIMWGAYALVDGTAALAAAIAGKYLPHRGWIGFTGLTGIMAGILTFAWPGMTAIALLYVIAAWAVVSGVSLMAIAFSTRKQLSGTWTMGLTGFLSVLLGTVLMVTPGGGVLAITWAISWWALLSGSTSLWMAWTTHRETSGTSRFRAASHVHVLG